MLAWASASREVPALALSPSPAGGSPISSEVSRELVQVMAGLILHHGKESADAGELSQAELHFLKARMRGGVLNKARRGELEMGPPVGLVYLPDGSMGIDPDREVQSAIRMLFDTFERTGSAMQTVRYFREEHLRFPRRIRAGERKGELLWGQAELSPITRILHNPRYAGAFVYGRTRTRRTPDGEVTQIQVPREQWQF
jgi:Recombinase